MSQYFGHVNIAIIRWKSCYVCGFNHLVLQTVPFKLTMLCSWVVLHFFQFVAQRLNIEIIDVGVTFEDSPVEAFICEDL